MEPAPEHCQPGEIQHCSPDLLDKCDSVEMWRCHSCGDEWDEVEGERT